MKETHCNSIPYILFLQIQVYKWLQWVAGIFMTMQQDKTGTSGGYGNQTSSAGGILPTQTGYQWWDQTLQQSPINFHNKSPKWCPNQDYSEQSPQHHPVILSLQICIKVPCLLKEALQVPLTNLQLSCSSRRVLYHCLLCLLFDICLRP